MTYTSHARTLTELRTEFVNDINRRIDNLTAQREVFGRGAAGKARFDARINELQTMLEFWVNIELVNAPKAQTKGTTQ
jgi:hypothetical protein